MSHSIALATPKDKHTVLKFAHNFYEQTEFSPSVQYNEAKVAELFEAYLEGGLRQVLFLLLKVQEETVGMLVGFATETPFSYDKIASELAWWVEPEHRGNRKALDLIYAYEAWALKIGCKHVSMSLLPALTDVSKTYERMGYKQTEISYLKEL